MAEPAILRFARDLPIRHSVDVLVAGGGPSGLAAAVTAARQGRSVFLAEGHTSFGGMGTAAMVPAFMQFGDGVHFLAGGFGHLADWVCRDMHPLENMPDYGRELTTITSQTGLVLLLDDPKGENETLLKRFVQLGIDLYGMARSYDKLWPANGGHCSGRKWPILFAGLMLDDPNMANVKALFAEDEQTYYGEGYRGQKALWQIHPNLQHEHLPPEKWKGPPFKGDNDGEKSEGCRWLNGPTWVGQALAARLMGARKNWNHDAFFDYVDRWWKEEVESVQGDAKKTTGAAGGPFVQAMWKNYREKADEIGAAVEAKRPRTAASAGQPATRP